MWGRDPTGGGVGCELRKANLDTRVPVWKRIQPGELQPAFGPWWPHPGVGTPHSGLGRYVAGGGRPLQSSLDSLAEWWEILAHNEAVALYGRTKRAGGEFHVTPQPVAAALAGPKAKKYAVACGSVSG